MDTKLLGLILQGDKKNEQEFNRIKETYEEMSNSKAHVITSSANGESIVLSDSSNSKLDNLRVLGKSEQVTTTGAQLLDLTGAKGGTSGGITVTVNADGSLTYSGTSDSFAINVWLLGAFNRDTTNPDNVLFTLPAGEYCIKGCALYSGTAALGLIAVTSAYGSINIATDTPITGIRASNVAVGSSVNTTIYPMLNKGSTPLPYEPYTGGIPSPNPQYPQEIVSAGDDGDIEANVCGGNLFDPKTLLTGGSESFSISDNGYTVTVTGGKNGHSGVYCRIIDVAKFAGKTAYLKADSILSTQNEPYRIAQVEIEDSKKQRKYLGLRSGVNLAAEIPIPEDAIRIDITLFAHNSSTPLDTANTVIFNGVQFTLDKNATWTPYKPAQLLAIPTPNGLPGIKVTGPSIATYTDEAGQMWCADEVDFERGVYVKRIENKTITSDMSITKSSQSTDVLSVFAVTVNTSSKWAMSDKFLYSVDKKENVFYTINDVYWFFRCDSSEIPDVDSFKGILPINVQYILATPIETPLSESELAAYKTLRTNYPVTTILNDSGAHMEVKYTADKKNYIDNKFAQITNAVLSMGSNI